MIQKTVSSLLCGLATCALVAAPVAAQAQAKGRTTARTTVAARPAPAPATASVPAVPAGSAQGEGAAAANPLAIPQNVQLLGKNDPNLRKPTAVVNGQIITGTDVDQRTALVIAASKNQLPPEEVARLRTQVLRNLIDETLQIQEAKAQEIEVTQPEVDQTYARVAAQNFGQNVAAMDAYLAKIGSSAASLKRQIMGELSWQRLLRRNVSPFVNVSAEEVNELMQRLEASRGTEEYRIGEIWLGATPETRTQVLANLDKIIAQLKQGGSFVGYARQFSESSTAAQGGDLGYVRLEMLPSELAVAARSMQTGQLVGPIENSGGFSILYLIDKRAVLTADARDAVLSLKQISIAFPKGATEAAARDKLNAFNNGVKAIKGCGDADAAGAAMGAEVVGNDGILMRSLPEQLQKIMSELQIGQSTPPFGSIEDGVRVLMLCGRDDPQTANSPSFDQLMSQLEDERVDKRAQRYLRDLRNDAVIEYN